MWRQWAAAGCLLVALCLPPLTLAGSSQSIVVLRAQAPGSITFAVNRTTYGGLAAAATYVEWDSTGYDEFRVWCWCRSTEASQTVSWRFAEDDGSTYPSIGSAGDALTVDNSAISWRKSNWLPITRSMSGFPLLALLARGSNGTVDVQYEAVGVSLRDTSTGVGPEGPTGPAGPTGPPCATPPGVCDVEVTAYTGEALDTMQLLIFAVVVVGAFAVLTLAWIAVGLMKR